ncbi:MAG: glycosyltransferase family 39 protein [Patescibacteria group bacterium]|nr:glycosyltransferase family 39 protein [Patescibacteria group bacterium]
MPLILLTAAALRLAAVLSVGDFTWDEMFSFTYSQKPWLDSLTFWAWETNPPLHLLLLKLWFYVFPANEFWQRLPSLIFGVLTVWWLYKIGRGWFSARVGLIAAALLALHPYHIFLSAFGRGYTLFLMLAVISLYYFLRVYFSPGYRRSDLVILALINGLALFTHLTAVFLFFVETIGVVAVFSKEKFKQWICAMLPAILVTGAWIAPSLFYKFFSSGNNMGQAWFFNFKDSPIYLLSTLKILFFGPATNILLAINATLFLCLLFFYFYQLKKEGRINPAFFLIFLLFFIPLLSAFIMKLWNIKFSIIGLPALVIVWAVLIEKAAAKNWLKIVLILGLTSTGILMLFGSFPLSDWRTVNRYALGHYQPEKKQIIVHNDFIYRLLVDRYYHGPIPVIFFQTERVKNIDDPDRAIITTNYLMYQADETEEQKWYEENKLNDFDEMFLIAEKTMGASLFPILEKNGWINQDRPVDLLVASDQQIFRLNKQRNVKP